MRPLRAALVALTVLLFAACTHEDAPDLVIRQRVSLGAAAGAPREVTIYVHGNTRVDDSDHLRKIIDLDAKTLTTAYKDKKTYTLRTFDQLREQAAEVQKRLDALPPQARELISTLAPKGEPLTLKPTGRVEKIAGYDANEYVLEGGGVTAGSVWVAASLDVPREGRDWQGLAPSLGGIQAPDQQLAQALKAIKGFPVRAQMTTGLGAQTLTLTTETLEVKQEPVPAEMLRAPEGFTQVEVPALERHKKSEG